MASLLYQREPLYSSGSTSFNLPPAQPTGHLIYGEILPRLTCCVNSELELVQILKDAGGTHATADTHRDHAELDVAPLHLANKLRR